jgi:hypothetical protein
MAASKVTASKIAVCVMAVERIEEISLVADFPGFGMKRASLRPARLSGLLLTISLTAFSSLSSGAISRRRTSSKLPTPGAFSATAAMSPATSSRAESVQWESRPLEVITPSASSVTSSANSGALGSRIESGLNLVVGTLTPTLEP